MSTSPRLVGSTRRCDQCALMEEGLFAVVKGCCFNVITVSKNIHHQRYSGGKGRAGRRRYVFPSKVERFTTRKERTSTTKDTFRREKEERWPLSRHLAHLENTGVPGDQDSCCAVPVWPAVCSSASIL